MSNTGRSLDGPDTSTDGNVAVFDGTSGDKVRDGGAMFLHQLTKSLTDDQIIHLPSTAVEIIAAPGNNKLLVPQVVLLHMKWVGDYGGIDADAVLTVDVAGGWVAQLNQDTLSGISALLDGGGPDGTWVALTLQQLARSTTTTATPAANPHFHHGVGDSGFYDSDIVNKPLTIAMTNGSGNLTGGNAGNALQISVAYMVLNTITGEFE